MRVLRSRTPPVRADGPRAPSLEASLHPRWLAPALAAGATIFASCTGGPRDEHAPPPPSGPRKPNILFILSDDQRADALECMGRFRNRVAGRAVRFTNYSVTTSLCCPARATILTGRYAHNHHVLGNGEDLEDDDGAATAGRRADGGQGGAGGHATAPLEGAQEFHAAGDEDYVFSKWFQEAGYATALFGKYLNGYQKVTTADADGDGVGDDLVPPYWDEWHAFHEAQYFNFALVERGRGFETASRVCYQSAGPVGVHDDAAGCAADADGTVPPSAGLQDQNYSTDVIAALAERFILDRAAEGQPFFLYFAPRAPHKPFYSPARYQPDPDVLEFTPEALERLESCSLWEWKDRPASYLEEDVSDKPAWVRRQFGALGRHDLEKERKMQLASLLATEDAIDRLLDALERSGVADDTIIVYSSDNGFAWGEHWWSRKNCPYEECTRVPLVIFDPRHPTGGVNYEGLAQNIDLAPTFAELAGIPIPEGQVLDGTSLAKIAQGAPQADPRDRALTECWGEEGKKQPDTHAAVRTSRWKFIEHYANWQRTQARLRRDGTPELELYDLERDPNELDNLLGVPPATLTALGYDRAEVNAVVADLAAKLHALEVQ